jgi:hypothetical protein
LISGSLGWFWSELNLIKATVSAKSIKIKNLWC